ncbi:hypothetical protein BU23DRAFT_462800 [Bimuria novae-zelandiae CBS 107.79]|uniref:LYR motif-containing protein 2 n=1 Tax=Bimuria novae-zelandiae CBS 107.79 TaxID=1447943 RepID=A0A6A5VBC3_9PLEO|nr:hypothetical protein BU23DRAFT_462800 [Bimuria novae-zelandiae CBS 107.79]
MTATALIKRTYATVLRTNSSRLRSRGKSPLGLDHFIQRQRALALWRDIVRSTASISEPGIRQEMVQFARSEFEKHRHVTDLSHIRYLISTGKTQFDTMKGTLINSGVLTEA